MSIEKEEKKWVFKKICGLKENGGDALLRGEILV